MIETHVSGDVDLYTVLTDDFLELAYDSCSQFFFVPALVGVIVIHVSGCRFIRHTGAEQFTALIGDSNASGTKSFNCSGDKV